jgi:outer membrane receptor protein involved in Fe transport
VADTRIEELRGEIYLSHFWNVSSELKVETSLTVEASRITQSGDARQERDFTYVKPRINATWDPGGPDQFRALLERDVAQLDFTEFASAVSLFDGTVDLGNPNLEPEQTWKARIDWERRFGAKGVLTLSFFHDAVESVQDQIPIAGQFDGPGNLGDGVRTGVRIDATAPLDAIGLKKGELRVTGLAQETQVDDPVTGEPRRFSGEPEWSYSIDLRQPLPEYKLLFGALYERADEIRLYRLKEVRTTQWADANLDLFAETTVIPGWVIRFSVSEILRPVDIRERAFFTPDRTTATNLSRIETRRATGGYGTRSYAIRVSGRF